MGESSPRRRESIKHAMRTSLETTFPTLVWCPGGTGCFQRMHSHLERTAPGSPRSEPGRIAQRALFLPEAILDLAQRILVRLVSASWGIVAARAKASLRPSTALLLTTARFVRAWLWSGASRIKTSAATRREQIGLGVYGLIP